MVLKRERVRVRERERGRDTCFLCCRPLFFLCFSPLVVVGASPVTATPPSPPTHPPTHVRFVGLISFCSSQRKQVVDLFPWSNIDRTHTQTTCRSRLSARSAAAATNSLEMTGKERGRPSRRRAISKRAPQARPPRRNHVKV